MHVPVRRAYVGYETRPRGTHVRWLPALGVVAILVLVAPLWPWSRGWGWVPAGMVAITLATIVLFTLSLAPS